MNSACKMNVKQDSKSHSSCAEKEGEQKRQLIYMNDKRAEMGREPNQLNTTQQQQRKRIRHSGGRIANKMIESFSEFLACRNVMNSPLTRYDKLPEEQQQQKRQDRKSISQACFIKRQEKLNSSNIRRSVFTNSSIQRKVPLRYNFNKLNQEKKQNKVKLLLRALVSRKQRNKRRLIIKLFRTPVVLAALFSLALCLTLMVLYTRSFFSHNCEHNSLDEQQEMNDNHRIFVRERQEQQKAVNNTNQDRTEAKNHRTNNHQLDIPSTGEREALNKTRSKMKHQEGQLKRALTVQTECGAYVGSLESEGIAFRGIAYASPPIGIRRWQRPTPVWHDKKFCSFNESRSATETREHCAQLSPMTRRFSGTEDCLYLDILTPRLGDQVKVSEGDKRLQVSERLQQQRRICLYNEET